MRIIVIPDIHGKEDWRWIIENEKAEKYLFLGDYFDSYDPNLSANYQIFNFNEIVRLKKLNPEKYTLLIGNHDYQYLPYTKEKYSGYQVSNAVYITKVIRDAIEDDLLRMCYLYKDYLFSHAGVSKTWANKYEIQTEIIEDSINNLFRYKPSAFEFCSGKNMDDYGDDITQPPIWIRPKSLMSDGINGYKQVVGHSRHHNITICDNTYYFVDTLDGSKEYMAIEDDGKITIKTIGNVYIPLKEEIISRKILLDNKKSDLLIKFLVQTNGKLSKRALTKEFTELKTEDIEYIETKFMEYYQKTGLYHFKKLITNPS